MHLGNAYRNPSKPAKIQDHPVFQLSPNLQNVASNLPKKVQLVRHKNLIACM